MTAKGYFSDQRGRRGRLLGEFCEVGIRPSAPLNKRADPVKGVVAELMIRSAMQRHESRGLHYTLDYPEQLAEARDTILTPTPQAQPNAAG